MTVNETFYEITIFRPQKQLYHITRGGISCSKNVELTSGRRKLHLQLPIPLCSFQRLVLGADVNYFLFVTG